MTDFRTRLQDAIAEHKLQSDTGNDFDGGYAQALAAIVRDAPESETALLQSFNSHRLWEGLDNEVDKGYMTAWSDVFTTLDLSIAAADALLSGFEDTVLHVVDNGRRWTVRLVRAGEHYGRERCLTHTNREPLVEWYDGEQDPEKFDAHGQFVSRYYIGSTLNATPGYGLDLHGGVPVWSVGSETVAAVRAWLVEQPGLEPWIELAEKHHAAA